MTTEDFDVGIKFIKGEYDQRQSAVLSRRDGPVVLQNLAKGALIRQTCNRVSARQVVNTTFGFQQRMVHVATAYCGRTTAPECHVITRI